MAPYYVLSFFFIWGVHEVSMVHMWNHIIHLKTVSKKNKFHIYYINCKTLYDTIDLSFGLWLHCLVHSGPVQFILHTMDTKMTT